MIGNLLTVDIEEGMQDGEEVVLYEGEPGDLRFRMITTAPHQRFRRGGNNLHTTATITLVIFLSFFSGTTEWAAPRLRDIALCHTLALRKRGLFGVTS
ncbi:putative chaperone DnaJ [Helianthus annuus]|nr:putative chaperone DnaJ [Helianthus annuus]